MLVLDRYPGESLRLGDEIEVTVTRIEGEQVKLGIEAPAELSIKREEIIGTTRSRLEPTTAASKEDGDVQGARIQYRKRHKGASDGPR